MSEKNVERARAAAAAFNEGDLDALRRAFTDDPEIVPLRAALESETVYRGPSALDEFWTARGESWSSIGIEIEELHDLGSAVAVVGWVFGTARETGAAVRQPCGWVMEFDEARIRSLRTYAASTREEALEAVGLRE